MSGVDRPDWGPGGEVRSPPVPAQPSVSGNAAPVEDRPPAEIVEEIEAEYPEPNSADVDADIDADDGVDPLEGMTDAQLETAETALGMMVEKDPTMAALPWATLPPDVRGLVVRVLADTPHLRGERFLQKLLARATLQQTVALDSWLDALPDELMGDEEL